MQQGSPAGGFTGGKRAASGDAKASGVSKIRCFKKMIPMPVGIETNNIQED
jgi:hypothetical protein